MAYDRPATPIAGRAPGLTGEKSWLIRLNDGATVTGTLVKNGEPLEGIGMTLSGKNRSAGEFAGYYDAVTDSKGQFHFFTIPALGDFVISAKMDTVGKHGATVARTIRLSKNGEIVDAGDLDVKPGVRLEGRVILSDGEALPPGTKLMIGRDEAWDSLSVELPPDGHFDLPNLPPESLNISSRVKGYRMSLKNPSLDRLNGFGVVGRLKEDTTGFVLVLDPGVHLTREEMEKGGGRNLQPRDEPLRSAIFPMPKNAAF